MGEPARPDRQHRPHRRTTVYIGELVNVDDVHVSCHDESDVRTCWSFTIDRLTFFEVTLDEDSNNLRAWRATLADNTFRPLRWLLPHDPSRRRLDENDEQVKQIIT